MKIQSSISVLSYKGNPLIHQFVASNGIKGAFVHKDDKKLWQVLEGKPDEQTGFLAAVFTTRREAKAFAGEINALLAEIGVIKPAIKYPLIKDLTALFVSLKGDIADDYRSDEFDESTTPSMSVTIGANEEGNWSCIRRVTTVSRGTRMVYPHWAVVTLHRRSNSTELARDVVSQLADLMHQ